MDCRTSEHSISDRLGDVSWVQKAALQLYERNVPLFHTSRYVISFTRPALVLVLQATNAGVKRPGYEARILLPFQLRMLLKLDSKYHSMYNFVYLRLSVFIFNYRYYLLVHIADTNILAIIANI